MTRAVLYARVSTDLQQKEGTIESQVAVLRRQIATGGHELVKEYIDDGYTGTLLDRPGLDQLRADLKTDLFDAVYFLAADRIARDVTYQRIIVGELIKYDKQIIINGIDYKNIPENKVTLTILGAVAEFERAKIIERMMRGKLHRLRKGEMVGGLPPFGYEYINKTSSTSATLAILGPQAAVVRTMFEMCANGGQHPRHYKMAAKKRDQNKAGQRLVDYGPSQKHAEMPYVRRHAPLSRFEHVRRCRTQAQARARW